MGEGLAEQPDDLARARVGRTIGAKWKLERLLGEGGMAAVYAATAPSGERAAIKVLHPEMTRRKDVRERFLREAYVANRIAHPGAVRVLSHGHDNETYLVMELLEGEPLSARAQRLSDFTVRELLGYANEILDVLAAAHDKGVIHRDIKPDNVFVTNDKHAKILDFGIARVLDDVPQAFKTRTGLALGTVPYMAPEQALGRRGEVDGRSDLFALGALLFRILSGRRIHDEKSEAELLVAMATRPAPSLATVAPNVPAPVSAVVDLALAFSRDARYPDARTMQKDVQALLAGHRPPYATSRTSRREASTRMDNPMLAAVPFGKDAATQVSQGQSSISSPDSMSAPTRVVVPPQPAAAQNVTAPLRAVEVPHSQRPGSHAIAMPVVDDLDALIMTLPPVPSAYGATLPAGAAPVVPPAPPAHDSAPPVSNQALAVAAPPTVPVQFAQSVPERKTSSSLALVLLGLFGVGMLVTIAVAAILLFTTGSGDEPAAESSAPPTPTPSASALPVDSAPAVEDPAPPDSASSAPTRLPATTRSKAATTSTGSKAIAPATRPTPSATAPPAAPPPTTAAKPPTPPPPEPREEKGKGKGKDKDK